MLKITWLLTFRFNCYVEAWLVLIKNNKLLLAKNKYIFAFILKKGLYQKMSAMSKVLKLIGDNFNNVFVIFK